MVVTVSNLVVRVFTASLIGFYTLVEVFLSFLGTFGVLKVVERRSKSSNEKEPGDPERNPEETKSCLAIDNENGPFSQDVQMETLKAGVYLGTDGDGKNIGDKGGEREEGPQRKECTERESEETPQSVLGRGNSKKEDYSLLKAALCSTWIPAVVGKQEQKIFRTAGIASLVTKTTCLALAIGLASCGINLHPRPFLVWCLDESSPLINPNSSVTYCVFDDKHPTWPNCKPDTTNYKNLPDFADSLEQLELVIANFEEKAKQIDKGLFQNELPSFGLQKIQKLRKEVDMLLRHVGLKGLTQKVRICGPQEFQTRIWTFGVLVVVLVLAALATFHLDKITSYKVGLSLSFSFSCKELTNSHSH